MGAEGGEGGGEGGGRNAGERREGDPSDRIMHPATLEPCAPVWPASLRHTSLQAVPPVCLRDPIALVPLATVVTLPPCPATGARPSALVPLATVVTNMVKRVSTPRNRGAQQQQQLQHQPASSTVSGDTVLGTPRRGSFLGSFTSKLTSSLRRPDQSILSKVTFAAPK